MALPADQWLLFLVRSIHILAGVLWVGGAAYAGLVVARTLADAPPTVRGPALARIGPVGFRVLTWAGAITIVFGAINQVLIVQSGASGGPEWNMILGIAFMIGVVMMGLAGAIIGPGLKKLAGGAAPADAPSIMGRVTKASMANIALGVLATLLMVYATKLRVI